MGKRHPAGLSTPHVDFLTHGSQLLDSGRPIPWPTMPRPWNGARIWAAEVTLCRQALESFWGTPLAFRLFISPDVWSDACAYGADGGSAPELDEVMMDYGWRVPSESWALQWRHEAHPFAVHAVHGARFAHTILENTVICYAAGPALICACGMCALEWRGSSGERSTSMQEERHQCVR